MDLSIDGAKGVLFNIVGGEDLTMSEVDEAAKVISQSVDPDANIIFGATIDEKFVDQVKITVIATGFDEVRRRLKELVVPEELEEKGVGMEALPEGLSPEKDKWDIPAFLRQSR